MTQYNIEIENVPEGYRPIRLGIPKKTEHVLTIKGVVIPAVNLLQPFALWLIVEKIK